MHASADARVRDRHRTRRRIVAAVLLVAVVLAGLAVHTLLGDSAATDIAGDALYAVAAYLAVVIVAPALSPLAAGAIAAAGCVAIELFQLTGIPLAAGAAFPPAMLLLGTVFDGRDLLVYLLTVVVVVGIDGAISLSRANRIDRETHRETHREADRETGAR